MARDGAPALAEAAEGGSTTAVVEPTVVEPPVALGSGPSKSKAPPGKASAGSRSSKGDGAPPPPRPKRQGVLQLNAFPWSEVYIGEQLVGTTPLKVILDEGEQVLSLRPLGFEANQEQVAVKIIAEDTVKYTHRFRN